MRMSLFRGVQRSAAAGGRLPSSWLADLRSRFSSAHPTSGGTATDQTPPDPRAETRPASALERDAHHLASRQVWRPSGPPFGGVVEAPGREKHPDAIELARFAVAEHSSNTNAALEFVRLLKVRHQLVAGTMYYFTVEVREVDGGANELYEAKVWVRPWQKFKGLEAFKRVAEILTGSLSV